MATRDVFKEIWAQKPPSGTIKPPEYPRRPDLFDEVEWGPYVTPEQAQMAYRLWSLPDGILGQEGLTEQRYPPPDIQAEWDSQDMHALVENVYNHLMRDTRLPDTDEHPFAQMQGAEERALRGWTYEEIFGSSEVSESSSESSADEIVLLEGEEVLKARYWTVVRLREELQKRGLDYKGKSAELRQRLHDDELQRRRGTKKTEKKKEVSGILPRADLSHWGIRRQDSYAIKITEDSHFYPRDMYTWAISLSPYNPAYWVSRAYLYSQQGFFDLAIGDAYRAQLLCEVLVNPQDRNRQPGLYPRIWHAIEQHILQIPLEEGQLPDPIKRMRGFNGVNYFIPSVRKALHNIISSSLQALRCWHDYDHMNQYLTQRVVMPDRDMNAFKERKAYTETLVKAQKNRKRRSPKLFCYEKRAGTIIARRYPYLAQDVSRMSTSFLEKLNQEIVTESQHPWKSFKIRQHHETSGELGVYVTEYIEEGRIIYAEEPSIRGHLNLTRHEDVKRGEATKPDRCDNCRRNIPENLANQYKIRGERESILNGGHIHACACAVAVDEPLYFCPGSQDSTEQNGEEAAHTESQGDETCLQIARQLYHFRACGRNWAWLHDAMRQNWNRHRTGSERRPTHITHTFEDHGTVLSLTLREVFDMTLLRRERSGNPYLLAHEIDELLPLQGDGECECNPFPFTLTANIQVPFDILLQLGVDIFRDLTFDTWVIQTVLRKLLINVVPWDDGRRGENDRADDDKSERIQNDLKERDHAERDDRDDDEIKYDPTFRALYLFPGFSMFNHTCSDYYNAEWSFDSTIPNRIVVWAAKGISPDTEIRIRYRPRPLSNNNALRTLGDYCRCRFCSRGDYRPPDETDESEPGEPRVHESRWHEPQWDAGGGRRDYGRSSHDHGGGDRAREPDPRDEEASTMVEGEETPPEGNIAHEQSFETSSRGRSGEDSSELPQEESVTDIGSQHGSLLEVIQGQVGALSQKRKRSAGDYDGIALPQERKPRMAFAGYKRQKPATRAPQTSAYFKCRS
ncbi:SAP domain protein [Paecilomyces variotii No. 5]|uniref:Histone-lysine N-methyltransferase SET5 n=1 Tax=Byssochlamys spectabilis (strain No. 5 / NBRC 109023) TaxID=1356009 RepID=V5FH09_BYSSN|nr:SAP domain protein [Paecilomyces variotii No. 5]